MINILSAKRGQAKACPRFCFLADKINKSKKFGNIHKKCRCFSKKIEKNAEICIDKM